MAVRPQVRFGPHPILFPRIGARPGREQALVSWARAAMIGLRVLGSTELRGRDGQTLLSVLSQPKRLALFTYLVLNASSGFVRRDRLLALFWPESDSDRARASLRKSLSYLRKSLGEDVVVTRGVDEVGIAAATVECDAIQFEAALDEGRTRAAWDHYGGALLDGMRVSEPGLERWLEDERSRLERRAVEAARALAEDAERLGDLDDAVVWARRALELEPLGEVGIRRLITVLGRAGDRDGAVRAYDAFAARLSADLGLEPDGETRGLVEAVRAGAGPSPAPVSIAPPATTSAVERELSPEPAPDPRPPVTRPLPVNVRPLAVSVLGLAALTLVAVFWGARRPATPEPVVRSIVAMAVGEEMIDLAGRRFALSPDGSRFAYVSGAGGPTQRRLWVRRRDELEARPIPGTEGALSPFFSPEGDRVGFISMGELRIVSLTGGPVVEVTDGVDEFAGVTWGSEGMLYASATGFGGLVRLPAEPASAPRPFTTLDAGTGETKHAFPDAFPGGRSVVFAVTRALAGAVGSEQSIAVADVETGVHKVLFDGIFARHAGPDHLLYVTTDSTLMVVPFDSEALEVVGQPSVVSREQRVGFRRSVDISVSRTGTLMYATGVMAPQSELVWVTRDGVVEPFDPPWRGDMLFPSISPDGSRVAVVVRGVGTPDVWVGSVETGGRHELTTEDDVGGYPSWSPDGRSVTYFARRSGVADLWTKPADGSGPAELQLDRPRDLAESLWSPDGQWLVYRTTNVPQPALTEAGAPVSGAGDVLAVRPVAGGVPIPLATTEFAELAPALSPDGRWLAYTSDEEGPREVFVIPFPNPDGTRWRVTPGGGVSPVWSQATGELFYRDARGDMAAIDVETDPTFSMGPRTVLFSARRYRSDGLHPMYAVTPDGQRFLMVRTEPRTPGELIVVENWFQELGGAGAGR